MITWLKDRVINVLIYGTIILAVGFMLYSAFLKPTNTQRTTVESGGTINQPWKDGQIKVGFGGCAHVSVPKELK